MSSEHEMSDTRFTNMFSIMIGGLIILTLGLITLAVMIGSDTGESDVSAAAQDKQVAERIKPVGQLSIAGSVASESGESKAQQNLGNADDSDTGSATSDTQVTEAASGESVYNGNCAACHNSGVAGAPVQGDAADWNDRVAQGVETLYKHAIEGYQGSSGMMPAKGGNPSLEDAEVKAAVDYMLEAAVQ